MVLEFYLLDRHLLLLFRETNRHLSKKTSVHHTILAASQVGVNCVMGEISSRGLIYFHKFHEKGAVCNVKKLKVDGICQEIELYKASYIIAKLFLRLLCLIWSNLKCEFDKF